MAKETKTVTFRIPKRLIDEVLDINNLNQSVVDCIEHIRILRLASMAELKGIFTPEEWKFFAETLNGTVVEGMFRCSAKALILHCEDSINYGISQFEVSLSGLTKKINNLKGANIEALYTRVEQFWSNPTDLEKWADF